MKTNLKVILSAIGVAALLAFPAMAKAQSVAPIPAIPPVFPPTTPAPGTVTAITATPTAGNNVFSGPGHGLQIGTICHDGGNVLIAFQNIGSDNATLNFLFSDGTTVTGQGTPPAVTAKVTAGGLVLAPGREFDAMFNNRRIEGQFIFANAAGNTTVSLHAFDGGSFCETRATAQFGPNPPPPPMNAPPTQ
jgi:hypothetical protein